MLIPILFLTSTILIRIRSQYHGCDQISQIQVIRTTHTHCTIQLIPQNERIQNRQICFSLTLQAVDIEPLFSGAAWAGTVVWPACIYLANYLCRQRKGLKRVIELGSGLGVPGIVAGLLGAESVWLTEQDPLVSETVV
jgi:predicted nicotinamide N-methyase